MTQYELLTMVTRTTMIMYKMATVYVAISGFVTAMCTEQVIL